MAKQKDTKITFLSDEADLERLLFHASRATGKLFAQTEDEVAREEQRQNDMSSELPETLNDPEATWRHANEGPVFTPLTPIVDAEIGNNLARAARQGKAIPKEVEDQMHRDREKVEQESKR